MSLTVPFKSKLTVSTRFLILEVFENRVSSFEALEEFFKDLEQRFRGNDIILENKTIAMNKTIDARLYSRRDKFSSGLEHLETRLEPRSSKFSRIEFRVSSFERLSTYI